MASLLTWKTPETGHEAGPPQGDGRLVAAGAYGALLLLGVGEGLIGSFQYSRAVGPVPIAALAFDLLILLTCVACAAGECAGPSAGLCPPWGGSSPRS